MIDTKELIKIKEYENYILYEHKNTGIRECFMKTDLHPHKNEIKAWCNTWERRGALTEKY